MIVVKKGHVGDWHRDDGLVVGANSTVKREKTRNPCFQETIFLINVIKKPISSSGRDEKKNEHGPSSSCSFFIPNLTPHPRVGKIAKFRSTRGPSTSTRMGGQARARVRGTVRTGLIGTSLKMNES